MESKTPSIDFKINSKHGYILNNPNHLLNRSSNIEVKQEFISSSLQTDNSNDSQSLQIGTECDVHNVNINGTEIKIERDYINGMIFESVINRNSSKKISDHTRDKPYKCNICNKIYSNTGNLKHHKKIHTGENPFTCKLCNKIFYLRRNLKAHIMIHTGEKPFKCQKCDKAFVHKGALRLHTMIHTGNKPFTCNLCSKKFSQAGSLKMHIMIHTGERPFKCHLCSKTFTQAGTLKVHGLTHTGEKPFTCYICFKTFALKYGIRKHIKTVHYSLFN